MKIVFVLGARSEWGYIHPVYEEGARRGHEVSVWACNTSVLHSYGNLSARLLDSGINVVGQTLTSVEGSTHFAMAKSVALVNSSFSDFLNFSRPDWVVLSGDRAEQLGAAIASTFQFFPTCHIQAGERSGNIDDMTRHALARLVHLHFAANVDAADRLIKAGEEVWRVITSGAPQLDGLVEKSSGEASMNVRHLLDTGLPYFVGMYHPVTTAPDGEIEGLNILLEKLRARPEPVYWIAPNNDAGAHEIRNQVISRKRAKDVFLENLSREDFAKLLAQALALVGNSSAGILEAPSFALPALNVGTRQADRLRGANVVDAAIDPFEIENGLKRVSEPTFRASLKGMTSPYGDGHSARRIVNALEEQASNPLLTKKRMEY